MRVAVLILVSSVEGYGVTVCRHVIFLLVFSLFWFVRLGRSGTHVTDYGVRTLWNGCFSWQRLDFWRMENPLSQLSRHWLVIFKSWTRTKGNTFQHIYFRSPARQTGNHGNDLFWTRAVCVCVRARVKDWCVRHVPIFIICPVLDPNRFCCASENGNIWTKCRKHFS